MLGGWSEFSIKLATGEYVRSVSAATRGSGNWPWCVGYLEVNLGSALEGPVGALRSFKFGRVTPMSSGSLQTFPAKPSSNTPIFGFHGNIGALMDTLGVIVCERSFAAMAGGCGSTSRGGAASSGSGTEEEAARAGILGPGRYRIFSKKSPKYCLDGYGGHIKHVEGTSIITFPARPGATNQLFDIQSEGGGMFTLHMSCCDDGGFVGLADDRKTLVLKNKRTSWAIRATTGGCTLALAEDGEGECGEGARCLQLHYSVTPLLALPQLAPAKVGSRSGVWVFVAE
jgi:hypothetical protein